MWLAMPFLGAGICCLALEASVQDSAENPVGTARATIEQWVETRRIISKEQRDWKLGREMLSERIEIVQNEIESLRAKIANAEESIAEADKKRAELIEENEKLKEASSALDSTVITLEQRTSELLRRLPEPIRQRVKPLSQRISDDPQESKLSLAERFQNVVGILNEVNKFNREITLTSEVRSLPDGSSAEVTAMYIGIGQGYYVNASATVAGVGTASADEWIWTPNNTVAADIARAVAILKNEQLAQFVPLPVQVK